MSASEAHNGNDNDHDNDTDNGNSNNHNSENKKKNNNHISNNNTRGAYTNKQHSLAVDAYRLQANIILTTTASGLFPA